MKVTKHRRVKICEYSTRNTKSHCMIRSRYFMFYGLESLYRAS